MADEKGVKKGNGSSYSASLKESSLRKLLETDGKDNIDIKALRKASWTGIPQSSRGLVWKILLGYLPTSMINKDTILKRKREEYVNSIDKFYGKNKKENLLEEDQKNLRQILVDIPRTAPDFPLFHSEEVRLSLERILYIWSVRHPASGYVQGMNDIATPIFATFLAHEITDGEISNVNKIDISSVDKDIILRVEADSFWCLTKLLDGIQDHYTCSQPGIQRLIYKLEGIINRIDIDLYNHFQEKGLMFIQFAFRWFNCLLLRELPLKVVIRLWDTYLSEELSGFDTFHCYVCAALLQLFSKDLRSMQSMEEMVMFLQDLPTQNWQETDVETLLSQAYILKTLFDSAPSHLV